MERVTLLQEVIRELRSIQDLILSAGYKEKSFNKICEKILKTKDDAPVERIEHAYE